MSISNFGESPSPHSNIELMPEKEVLDFKPTP